MLLSTSGEPHDGLVLEYGRQHFKKGHLVFTTYCGPITSHVVPTNCFPFTHQQYNSCVDKNTDSPVGEGPKNQAIDYSYPKLKDVMFQIGINSRIDKVFFLMLVTSALDPVGAPPVATVIMSSNTETDDPLRKGLFQSYTAHHSAFNICVPEINIHYMDEVLEALPSCYYSDQSDMYNKAKGYLLEENKNFSFDLPSTFDDYLMSLSKKHRSNIKQALAKNSDLECNVLEVKPNVNLIHDLFSHNPTFVKAYMSNVNRQVHNFGELETTTAHINNALMSLVSPLVLEISKDGEPLVYNIGELLYKRVKNESDPETHTPHEAYVDRIAIPVCSDEEYKARSLGIYCIAKCIEYLILVLNSEGLGPKPRYYLDTGHGDYKSKFLPKPNIEQDPNVNSNYDYTSVSVDYINSKEWASSPLRAPLHIKGTGWVFKDEDRPIPKPNYRDDIYLKVGTLEDFGANAIQYLTSNPELELEDSMNINFERKFFLAMDSFEVAIGFCIITKDAELNIHYMDNLYIDPLYRKVGLSTRLLDFVHSKIKTDIVLHVKTANEEAISLYKKMGYTETGKVPCYYEKDDVTTSALLFTREYNN